MATPRLSPRSSTTARAAAGAFQAAPAPLPIAWTTSTALVAWCVTCGTDVEFVTPYGLAPEDLAADEHACVWCGEALLVTVALGEYLGGREIHAA